MIGQREQYQQVPSLAKITESLLLQASRCMMELLDVLCRAAAAASKTPEQVLDQINMIINTLS